MKVVLSVVFVVLCTSTLESFAIPDELVRLGFVDIPSLRILETPRSCSNENKAICKDCSTYMRCVLGENVEEKACRTVNPDTPYCHNGGCVANLPEECQSPFSCTGSGYYPDARNCSRYHLCANVRATSTAYAMQECPAGFVYNPATTLCRLSRDCNPVDCSSNPADSIPYPDDNRYYVFCIPNDVPVILKCAQYFVYKPSDKACVFQCPREGRIAVPNRDAEYYECNFD